MFNPSRVQEDMKKLLHSSLNPLAMRMSPRPTTKLLLTGAAF